MGASHNDVENIELLLMRFAANQILCNIPVDFFAMIDKATMYCFLFVQAHLPFFVWVFLMHLQVLCFFCLVKLDFI